MKSVLRKLVHQVRSGEGRERQLPRQKEVVRVGVHHDKLGGDVTIEVVAEGLCRHYLNKGINYSSLIKFIK